jgi:peptide/nickel transport system substrate-binding protein
VLRQTAISAILLFLALSASARTRPHYGGTLHVEIEGDPSSLNAAQSSGIARRLIFDGLTRIGSHGIVQPALAVRWASENNDHRWQFWLRPGVRFQDGSPLTSPSIESSLTSSCGSACPWSAVHAVGSSVVFTTDSPMPNLPALIAGNDFLITHAGAVPGPIIGTGAFQVDTFSNGVLTLVANDSCWAGRPFLDKIEIEGNKSIRDQGLDLSVGRADLVEVPAEELRRAQQEHLTIIQSPPIQLLALAVADSGALSNPNLRAAIALAVDRTAISNVIFQKQGEITASLLPSVLTGYSFLFHPERDVNKAHDLRGGLNAPTLTLRAEGGATMQLAAQRIALNLRESGLNVQVAAVGSHQHADLILLRETLSSDDPPAALESLLRAIGVATPVIDQAPAGLYKTERDFLETHTLIPLLYLPRAYAVSSRVRDLRLSADGLPLLAGSSLLAGAAQEDVP